MKPIPRDLLEECFTKTRIASNTIAQILQDDEHGGIVIGDIDRFVKEMRTANAFANTLQLRTQGVKEPKRGD